MHKRHLHHLLVLIRKIRVFYLVALIAVGVGVSVFGLRDNNLQAIKLRDQVLKADQQNADVETPLRELREFTYGHMGSHLASPTPPVQLKYRYDRLTAEQKAKEPSNTQLATQAQNYCEAQIPTGRSLNRIDCIQNYILGHGAQASKPIPDALYKFDFIAPAWSPDLAGWSIVLTVLFIVVLLVRVSAVAWLKHVVKQHA